MARPSSVDVFKYQQKIDRITGTRDGRSLIKLAWAPEELRWRPRACSWEQPPTQSDYSFPIFIAYHDEDGNEVAAPRWVLLQRIEPEQYARTWEATRYSINAKRHAFAKDPLGDYLLDRFGNPVLIEETGDDRLWDWSGPCPTERYVELRAVCAHDGLCCPCLGDECQCGPEYFHCWGRYREPDESLLDWVRKTAWQAAHDPDVNPTQDVECLESAHAQIKLRDAMIEAQEQKKEKGLALNNHMLNHWERKPVSTNGFKESNGLLIPN